MSWHNLTVIGKIHVRSLHSEITSALLTIVPREMMMAADCSLSDARHSFLCAKSTPMLLFRVQSKLTYRRSPTLRPNSVSMSVDEFLPSLSCSKKIEAVPGGDGTSCVTRFGDGILPSE